MFFQGTAAHEGDDSIVLMRKDRRVILTWILYISTLTPAILMDSTGKVLSVTGSIAGSSLAYIVPGLTYIAIHSNAFIDMVHKQWQSSNYLLGYPKVLGDGVESEKDCHTSQHLEISEERTQQMTIGYAETSKGTRLSSGLRVIFWYVTGMPFWCIIAEFGQKNLAEHFEREDMVSPSLVKPKRVTVVKPTWQPSTEVGIARSSSDTDISHLESKSTEQTPLLGPILGSTDGSNIVAGNQGVAKMIALNNPKGNMMNRTNSLTSAEVENELHIDVPTWVDFLIAISYIVLGVVAMVWGVVSVIIS